MCGVCMCVVYVCMYVCMYIASHCKKIGKFKEAQGYCNRLFDVGGTAKDQVWCVCVCVYGCVCVCVY